jgi:hypothetical protein
VVKGEGLHIVQQEALDEEIEVGFHVSDDVHKERLRIQFQSIIPSPHLQIRHIADVQVVVKVELHLEIKATYVFVVDCFGDEHGYYLSLQLFQMRHLQTDRALERWL